MKKIPRCDRSNESLRSSTFVWLYLMIPSLVLSRLSAFTCGLEVVLISLSPSSVASVDTRVGVVVVVLGVTSTEGHCSTPTSDAHSGSARNQMR